MAKKNVQPESVEVEVIAPETEEKVTSKKSKKTEKTVKEETTSKKDKDVKSNKDKAKNNTAKKEKKSLKKKASEIWSELKKVSKPTFGKVVKNTCVVIAVVAICTLLLFGMDKLLSLVYDLLIP